MTQRNIRTIRLVTKPEGDWFLFDDRNEAFASENDTIKIVIGYGTAYDGFRKRADIFLTNDKSIDYIEADVNNEFEFFLTSEHLKQGLVKIQPIAYLFDESKTYGQMKKQKWQVYSLKVNNSLNVGESTVNVDKTLGQELSDRIEDLEVDFNLLSEDVVLLESQVSDLEQAIEDIGEIDLTTKMEVDGSNSDVNKFQFNTTVDNIPTTAGQLGWDRDEGTLDLVMNGGSVTQSIGLELFYRVKNKTGATIPNGSLVMADGTDGNSGVINVKKYDGVSPRFYIMGIATEDIGNDDLGFITWFGKVRGLDTRGGAENWQNGEILYPSTTVAGGLTKTPQPQFADHPVAIVINRQQQVGTLFVRVL